MIKLLLVALAIPFLAAHGHGQGLDTISDVLVDGTRLSITVELPTIFEGGAEQITITAFEESSGEAAQNVTFLIGLYHDNKMMFRNYFFAQDGSLELAVEPNADDAITIHGEQDELLGAWSGDPVRVTGPLLDSGGLYKFEIEVRTIHDRTNIIEDSGVYEADVSVADTYEFEAPGSANNVERFVAKSYFDKISSFEYDPEKTVSFEMPFDWREKKITHIPVVHVEVSFPKDAEFFSPGYEGYVNGAKLFKSSVSIDDYTRTEDRIVHFVLLQDHLRNIKGQFGEGDLPDMMTFELQATQTLEFPLSAYTRSEDFEVNLSWEPREVTAGEETDFIFTIRDGATGEPLRRSDYTFVILLDGKEIHRTSGIAQIGGHFERYTFSDEETGPVIVRFEDIRGTGQETEFGLAVAPRPAGAQAIVQEPEGGGCLIATAAYGTEMAPQIQQLRELRENMIMSTESGSAFMEWFNGIYYTFSPGIADLERENPAFRDLVRISITPMVSSLSILNHLNINTEAEMIGYGISIIVLNLTMYAMAPALAIACIAARLPRALRYPCSCLSESPGS